MKLQMSPKVKEILEWVYCILIAIVLALLVRYYVGTPTIVQQPSMYPTLKSRTKVNFKSMGKNHKRDAKTWRDYYF